MAFRPIKYKKNIVRLLCFQYEEAISVGKKYNWLSDLKLNNVPMKKILLFWVQDAGMLIPSICFLDRKAEEDGALVFPC